MSDRKKVSICIPAYNNEQAMRRLLASIEMQSYKDYEVILTDDSDTDGIRKLAEEKEYVRYHKNEKRLGATANWNAAIAKSSGEYIKIMHHDDWFTDENSLQAFVDMLEEHPEADMAFCGSRQVETDGNVGEAGSQESHGNSYDRFTSKEDIRLLEADYRNLFLGNTIGAPSAVIVRRSAIEREPGNKSENTMGIVYDEKLTWLVDMEYYMHILSRNPHFAYTDRPLVSIGVGKEQLTEKCRDDKELNVFEYGYIYQIYDLVSEKKYRQKLIQICADAGKTYEDVSAYEIPEKEYKKQLRSKFISKVEWKLSHMLDIDKIAMLLLYLSVTLEILIVIIDKSNYTNPIEGQLFRLTFLLAAGKVFFTRYSRKEWIAIVLFGLLGLVSWRVTGRNEILRIVAFIAACKGTDVRKLLKYVFYTTLAGCLTLVFLSVTGIYGGLALEADFGRGYVQVRYCLGLGHPNALHCMFMMLMLLGLYLYNESLKWYHYVVLFVLNYGMYLLTDSNTGMLMTFCAIVGAVMMRYVKGMSRWKWVYVAGVMVFLACVLFSVLAAESRFAKPINYWFANPLIAQAESHLNGRIKDLYYGSTRQEGTTATWRLLSGPENQQYFDMGFVRLFYWYGIIPGMIYVVLQLLLARQFYKKRDGMGLVMMTVLAVYTVVEAHIVSVYIGRNYLLFLMGMYGSSMLGLEDGREEYWWRSYRLLKKDYNYEAEK